MIVLATACGGFVARLVPQLNPSQTLLSAWLACPRYAQGTSLIVMLR